jgi:hypothetical protein
VKRERKRKDKKNLQKIALKSECHGCFWGNDSLTSFGYVNSTQFLAIYFFERRLGSQCCNEPDETWLGSEVRWME